MHVETVGRKREHARRRPLLRPKADPRENSLLASHKFAKEPAASLWINFSRENFYARYPGFLDLALVLVGSQKLACINASLRQLLRERCGTIITRCQCLLSSRIDALPKVVFSFVHLLDPCSELP